MANIFVNVSCRMSLTRMQFTYSKLSQIHSPNGCVDIVKKAIYRLHNEAVMSQRHFLTTSLLEFINNNNNSTLEEVVDLLAAPII